MTSGKYSVRIVLDFASYDGAIDLLPEALLPSSHLYNKEREDMETYITESLPTVYLDDMLIIP